MVGYAYETANEYVLLQLIKYLKKKNMNYSVYSFYVIMEQKLDFNDFNFKVSNYYLKYVGEVKENKWLKNGYYAEFDTIKEIVNYNRFKLKKDKGNIYLYINKDKYKMQYEIEIMKYYYKRKESEFFEKDYRIAYSINDENTNNSNIPDKTDISWVMYKNPNEKYKILLDDLTDRLNEGMTDQEIKENMDIDPLFNGLIEEIEEISDLDFDIFYKYYFSKLTLNQKKICALYLLGIRITDIARLMGTTQVYITIEWRRIARKIRKQFKKTGQVFWICQ